MQYKILETSETYTAAGHAKQPAPWVKISVDFEDGTPVYEKRMTADISSLESIDGAVRAWWADYEPQRAADLAAAATIPDSARTAIADAIAKNTAFAVASALVDPSPAPSPAVPVLP